MRLRLRCGSASTFPTTIVSTARIVSAAVQMSPTSGATNTASLRKPTKAPALTPVAMNAVTGVGAPW